MKFNFIPFPELTTSRLLLRQAREDDCEAILFLRSNEEVNKYVKRPTAGNLNDARGFLKKITSGIENGENMYWSITLKGDSKMIGSICLWNFSADKTKAEIGYDLHPKYQNQGIMFEALKVVLDFGFGKLALTEVEAYTHFANKASIRLLEKHGFSLIKGKKDEGDENNVVFAFSRS